MVRNKTLWKLSVSLFLDDKFFNTYFWEMRECRFTSLLGKKKPSIFRIKLDFTRLQRVCQPKLRESEFPKHLSFI